MNRRPTLVAHSVGSMSPSSASMSSGSSTAGDMEVKRGKKRRLDHLSYEEKVQRKKLKNRVAAQTSRDRKKMKMDEMEQTLATLAQENSKLKGEFRTVQVTNQSLRLQNDSLQQQLEILRQRLDDQEKRLEEKDRELESLKSGKGAQKAEKVNDIAFGSAASTDVDPQQKGLSTTNEASVPSNPKTKTTSSSVWQVIALCLLYKICSKQQNNIPVAKEQLEQISSTAGKSLPKLYSQISTAKWQTMLKEAAMGLPRMQAPYHSCLDSWWGPEQSAWNPQANVEVEA